MKLHAPFLWLFALALSACSQLQGSNPMDKQASYVYPGAALLVPNDDGTHTLTWPAAPYPSVSYQIFERHGSESFRWDKPVQITSETVWRTADLRFAEKSCFAVRFSTDTYKNDKNEKEVCTTQDGYVFPGVGALDRLESGNWQLSWEAAPFKDARYEIFEQDPVGGIQSTPLRVVAEARTRVGPFRLGSIACFVVRLVVGERRDIDGNTKALCTDSNALGAFSGIEQASSPATGQVRIAWTASANPDVVGYTIYRGPNFTELLQRVSGRETTGTTLEGFTPFEKVTFGVRAVSSFSSEDSNTKEITTQIRDSRPLAFEGVSSAILTNPGEITVKWSAVPHAALYRIYLGRGPVSTTPSIDWSRPAREVPASAGAEIALQDLGDELAYGVAVRVVSEFQVEDGNQKRIFVNTPDSGAPVFAGVKSAEVVNGNVVLKWDPPLGEVAKYRIYRVKGPASALDFSPRQNSASSSELPSTEPGTSLTTSVSGFQSNQSYSFAVRAEDSHGNLDANTTSLTMTVGGQSLPTFQGYVGAEGTSETNVRLSFVPTIVGNVAQYKILGRKAGLRVWSVTLFEPQNAATAAIVKDIGNLAAKTNYEFLVHSIDQWGNESTNEATISATTLDLTPPAFDGVTGAVQNAGEADIVVSWPARTTSDIDSFRVYWGTVPLSGLVLNTRDALPLNVFRSARIEGTESSLRLRSLTKGATYYFSVHALDLAGNETGQNLQDTTDMSRNHVSLVVLNTFPGLAADTVAQRTPEREPMGVITLTATDPDGGDPLSIVQVATTCPDGFAKPVLTLGVQNGLGLTATVNWTPSQGFIETDRGERTCSVTYKTTDGQADSPHAVLSLTAYNRDPRNVTAAVATPIGGFGRNKDMTCAGSSVDDDGEIPTFTYQWLKNGAPIAGATNATLTPAQASYVPNDSVVCQATAYDGHARVVATSTPVVLGNALPTSVAIALSEDGTSLPLQVGDVAKCQWSATDPDSDTLTYGAVSLEQSNDGATGWVPSALVSSNCSLQTSVRKCFTVDPSVSRKYLRCKLPSVQDPYGVAAGAPWYSSTQLVENSPPRINSVTLSPTTGLGVGSQLTCVADVSDADNDPLVSSLVYKWTAGGVVIAGANTSTFTLTTAERNKTVACQVETSLNPDGFPGAVVGPRVSNTVSYTNTNPLIASVTLTPTGNAATGDLLTCSATALDPDGDTVDTSKFSYAWKQSDGSTSSYVAAATSPLLVVQAGQRGYTLRCEVTLQANADGHGSIQSSPVLSSGQAAPVNSTPVLSNVNVTADSAPAYTGTVLTCNVDVTDADGDTLVDQPRYTWRVNGATVPAQTNKNYSLRRTDRGKNTTCTAALLVGADGHGSVAVSPIASSNAIVSVNSEPVVGAVSLTTMESPPYYPGMQFNCSIPPVSDTDLDTVVPVFQWFVDEVEIPSQNNATYVAQSSDRGKAIKCGVHLPANADANGSAEVNVRSSSSLAVGNRAPNGNWSPNLQEAGGGSIVKTATLACLVPTPAPTLDADGDPLAYKYIWFKNGAVFPGTSSSGQSSNQLALTSDATIHPSDSITCKISLHDGLVAAPVESNSSSARTVINRIPDPGVTYPVIAESPLYSSTASSTLTCSMPVPPDADGDTVTMRYYLWRRIDNTGTPTVIANQVGNPVFTHNAMAGVVWNPGDAIWCDVQASDPWGASVLVDGMEKIVANSPPVGDLQCNGGSHSAVAYAGQSIGTLGDCSASTVTDADGDAMDFRLSSTLSTCASVNSGIYINSSNGSVWGIMPSSPCTLVIEVFDARGSQAKTAGGAFTRWNIDLTMPFAAEMGGATVDSQCRLQIPTRFQSALTGLGSSTFSFSNNVYDVKEHLNPSTLTGLLRGQLNPATSTGVAQVQWDVVGSNAAYSVSIVRTLNIAPGPAAGSLSSAVSPTQGVQTQPELDVGGTQAASCSVGTCSGTPASLAAMGSGSCSLSNNGKAYCWGDNSFGQLGLGTLDNPSSGTLPVSALLPAGLTPVQLAAGSSVTAGSVHVCAVLEDQSTTPATNAGLACWGNNTYGELGTGQFGSGVVGENRVPTPVRILNGGAGAAAVKAVSAGGAHTCVLMGNGALACFGRNDKGQLGTTTQQDEPSPQWVAGFAAGGAKAVSAGTSHTCALTNLGSVICWGNSDKGQLGIPLPYGTTLVTSPVQASGLSSNMVAVATGDKHSCALKNNGTVYCWGDNSKGQLGSGFLGTNLDTPALVPDLAEVISISAGGQHTCALKSSGEVYCWGSNTFGELGNNTTLASGTLAPQMVTNLASGAIAVVAGTTHTCILKALGQVACFGSNGARELGFDGLARQPGNAALPNNSLTPVVPPPQFLNCPALRAFPL